MSLFHPSHGRIDRYLADGLSPGAEKRLRHHLGGCESCRRYYDQGVLLLRAARRVPAAAGAGEGERIVRRATQLDDTSGLPAVSRRPLLFGAGVAALAAGVFIVVTAFPAAPPPGRIASMSGEVVIGGKQASLEAEVRADETVEVRSGELVIALEGGRTALLRTGAKVKLSRAADVVTLEAGRGRFSVTPGQGQFAVVAGSTMVTVKGTIFAVERKGSGETLVAVHEGKVDVSAEHGAVSLTDGQETTVASGTPSPARAASRESLVEDRGGTDVIKKLKREGTRIIKGWDKVFGN